MGNIADWVIIRGQIEQMASEVSAQPDTYQRTDRRGITRTYDSTGAKETQRALLRVLWQASNRRAGGSRLTDEQRAEILARHAAARKHRRNITDAFTRPRGKRK